MTCSFTLVATEVFTSTVLLPTSTKIATEGKHCYVCRTVHTQCTDLQTTIKLATLKD